MPDPAFWSYAAVTPVPLPGSAWFMLSALGGLGFMARRHRAEAEARAVQMGVVW